MLQLRTPARTRRRSMLAVVATMCASYRYSYQPPAQEPAVIEHSIPASLRVAPTAYSYQPSTDRQPAVDAGSIPSIGAVYSYSAPDAAAQQHAAAIASAVAADAASSYDPLASFGTLNRVISHPPPPSPLHVAAAAVATPAPTWDQRAQFWTHRGSLRTNIINGGATTPEGSELKVKGVSWFGLESKPCLIGGLDQMPVEAGAAYLAAQGFNAVRVPLAVSALLSDQPDGGCMPPQLSAKPVEASAQPVDAHDGAHEFEGITFIAQGGGSSSGFLNHNPTFRGLSYLQLLQRFVRASPRALPRAWS